MPSLCTSKLSSGHNFEEINLSDKKGSSCGPFGFMINTQSAAFDANNFELANPEDDDDDKDDAKTKQRRHLSPFAGARFQSIYRDREQDESAIEEEESLEEGCFRVDQELPQVSPTFNG